MLPIPRNSQKRWLRNNLGQIFLPHFLPRLPDRGEDIIRADEAFMELHPEELGLLVKLHPGDSRDCLDFGAHGVGTAHSEKAAPLFHASHLKGYFSQELLFHLGAASSPSDPHDGRVAS